MKYAVLVGDGMADYPIEELNNRTPLETAHTPNMDFIARNGRLGRVKNIPDKMTPASDIANLSILGYNPCEFYTGRGPLEAANLGLELQDNDVAFRCNLVTISDEKLMDYSAGHISSHEAAQLMDFLESKLGSEKFKFYPGISYRHLLLCRKGAQDSLDKISCKAPHDIMNREISKNWPQGTNSELLVELMQRSRQILESHEINQVRVDLKENPANMIWLWGQGKKPKMPLFKEKFGLNGSVISAVDLIKGLGKILGFSVINVPGATGYYDTNYEGKANAALKALEKDDFVFVHVEAPDEAGHNGELREKVTAIERFDHYIVGALLKYFSKKKGRILVLPDHATPVSLRTHTAEPICFGIFGEGITGRGFAGYNEKEAAKSELYFDKGHELMDYLINYSFDAQNTAPSEKPK